MGVVIRFPEMRRLARELSLYPPRHGAAVIILPVVRVDRAADAPPRTGTPKNPSGGKRRRRASRT
jgi:hypothetical protein